MNSVVTKPWDAPRAPRTPFIGRDSMLIGAFPAVLVACVCLASGAHQLYGHGDADLFLAVARSPFGSGAHFPGDHLAQGVAYRYGRVLFPALGWALGLGRAAWITWSLVAVFVVAVGWWFAAAAELLRRAGRDPRLAWLLMLMPFGLVWMSSPTVISEPLACALLLSAYLAASEHRTRRSMVFAALTILAREALAIVFLPLAWHGWKTRGWRGALEWLQPLVPYAMWSIWVRFRVGRYPLLDPATTRRFAFAAPFAGWAYTLGHPMQQGQGYGLLIGALTMVVATFVFVRARGNGPFVQATFWLCAFIACCGWAVWQFPSEALRVMAPAQTMLFISVLSASAAVPDVGACPGNRTGSARAVHAVGHELR
jgi:hypothetical protein